MTHKIDITVVILTLNEEVNMEQCIGNVISWAKQVYVLDSGSSDKTVQLATELGAKTFFRKFDNYANQRNYAIQDLPIETEWILFLDADEYLSHELKNEIRTELENPMADGYFIKFRFIFMGRWIKRGGYYGTKILRLFRREKAKVTRAINEHVSIDGITKELKNDFIHDDNKGLEDWIAKHNRYSKMEALQLLEYDYRVNNGTKDSFAKLTGTPPQRKRWIRENIWNRFLGPYSRPIFYFCYRYFLRFGFLDGRAGLAYHLLHSFCMVLPTGLKYIELKRLKEKSK